MAFNGNNGREYGEGVGYIAPSPPIGDKESGYWYFPGGPIYSNFKENNMSDKLEIPLVVPYVPDPKKHLYISIAKSVLRFFGYGLMLFSGNTLVLCAAIPLIIAEVLGIIEELV